MKHNDPVTLDLTYSEALDVHNALFDSARRHRRQDRGATARVLIDLARKIDGQLED